MEELLETNEEAFSHMVVAFIELLKAFSMICILVVGVFVATFTIFRYYKKKKKNIF